MERNFRLGGFEVIRKIAGGGFGEIWLARHPRSDVRYAVKTLGGRASRRPGVYDAFAREVEAVARLNHPAIVAVHDFGRCGPEAERATHGLIAADAPWLVMDYLPGGPVDERVAMPWPALLSVLGDVLHGLAHAHARGILHLDLKPSNVLRRFDPDGQERYVLTDFGTAVLLDAETGQSSDPGWVAGTPLYMSPERFFGEERDWGPWSDLYAVGVMAWQLSCGRVPFDDRDVARVASTHAREALPPLADTSDAPEGLMAWLGGMCAKDPWQRYRDAAEALAGLGQVAGSPRRARVASGQPASVADTTQVLARAASDLRSQMTVAGTTVRERARPVVPSDWREAVADPPAHAPDNVGLGLVGRRIPALVGRHAERDALWLALRDSTHTPSPVVVVIEGASGVGKSRLARWVAESASEAVGAFTLYASHSSPPAAHDGVVPMLARALRVRAADPPDLLRFCRRLLQAWSVANEYDVEALSETLRPVVLPEWSGPVPWTVRLVRPAERFGVVARLVRRVATRHPVVMVVDDAQWGADSVEFVRHLAELPDSEAFSALVVLTCRREARVEESVTFEQIDGLHRFATTRTLPLAPLPDADQVTLLNGLAGFDEQVAAEIAARTVGNPLFAVQLVRHWADTGLIREGEDGYQWVEGAVLDAPVELRDVWRDRIEAAVADAGWPERRMVRLALERAAVLGTSVDIVEWRGVCGDVPGGALDALVDALRRHHLITEGPGRWSFLHAMLRETVEWIAARAGRAPEHHAAVAGWLEQRDAVDRVQHLRRLADHLEGARLPEEAFERLLELLKLEWGTELSVRALVQARARRALAAIDPDRRALREVELEVAVLLDDTLPRALGPAVIERLTAMRALAESAGRSEIVWDIDSLLVGRDTYELVASRREQALGELLDRAIGLGDVIRQLQARVRLGSVQEAAGHTLSAIETTQSLLTPPPSLAHHVARINGLGVLHRSLVDQRRHSEASRALDAFESAARGRGSRELLLLGHLLKSEVCVRAGDYAVAEHHLAEAIALAQSAEPGRAAYPLVHRVALYARWSKWTECLAAMDEAGRRASAAKQPILAGFAVLYASPAMAVLGERARWDALVPAALELLERGNTREAVVARAVAQAGLEWLRVGEPERAALALSFAGRAFAELNELGLAEQVGDVVAGRELPRAFSFLDDVAPPDTGSVPRQERVHLGAKRLG